MEHRLIYRLSQGPEGPAPEAEDAEQQKQESNTPSLADALRNIGDLTLRPEGVNGPREVRQIFDAYVKFGEDKAEQYVSWLQNGLGRVMENYDDILSNGEYVTGEEVSEREVALKEQVAHIIDWESIVSIAREAFGITPEAEFNSAMSRSFEEKLQSTEQSESTEVGSEEETPAPETVVNRVTESEVNVDKGYYIDSLRSKLSSGASSDFNDVTLEIQTWLTGLDLPLVEQTAIVTDMIDAVNQELDLNTADYILRLEEANGLPTISLEQIVRPDTNPTLEEVNASIDQLIGPDNAQLNATLTEAGFTEIDGRPRPQVKPPLGDGVCVTYARNSEGGYVGVWADGVNNEIRMYDYSSEPEVYLGTLTSIDEVRDTIANIPDALEKQNQPIEMRDIIDDVQASMPSDTNLEVAVSGSNSIQVLDHGRVLGYLNLEEAIVGEGAFSRQNHEISFSASNPNYKLRSITISRNYDDIEPSYILPSDVVEGVVRQLTVLDEYIREDENPTIEPSYMEKMLPGLQARAEQFDQLDVQMGANDEIWLIVDGVVSMALTVESRTVSDTTMGMKRAVPVIVAEGEFGHHEFPVRPGTSTQNINRILRECVSVTNYMLEEKEDSQQ